MAGDHPVGRVTAERGGLPGHSRAPRLFILMLEGGDGGWPSLAAVFITHFKSLLVMAKLPTDGQRLNSVDSAGQSTAENAIVLDESPKSKTLMMQDVVRPSSRRGSFTGSLRTEALNRLDALRALHEQGFIGDEEMHSRKRAIINQATILPSSVSTSGCSPVIVSRTTKEPPNLAHVVHLERAIRYMFDYSTMQWECDEVFVRIDRFPFAKGSLRLVYHLALDGAADQFVAKLAIDPDEDPQIYFRDIELQAHCGHYAELYNEYNPPKRVDFVQGWVLELTQRGGALCGVV